MSPAFLFLLAFCFPRLFEASSGDRRADHTNCLHTCARTGCVAQFHQNEVQHASQSTCPKACARHNSNGRNQVGSEGAPPMSATAIPLALRLFKWSCEDDCKYHCMRIVEELKASHSVRGDVGRFEVEKYYGKWPFVRVWGMQELASVLASIANLVVHIVCLARLRAHVRRYTNVSSPSGPSSTSTLPTLTGSPTRSYPFFAVWATYGCVQMNAWFCSALFHARDTRLTERMDYTGAILVVGSTLLTATVRVLWGPRRRDKLLVAFVSACVATWLAYHLNYMLRVKFDYGWNMKVCISLAVVTALVWLVWNVYIRHPARRRMYSFLVLLHASMLLEVLDFPPIGGILDAHACWHIATVFITPLFYSYLQDDVAFVVERHKESWLKAA